MTTTLEQDHVELNSRQEALESNVLLLCPTIGWWKGMYQLSDRNTETVTDGKVISSDDVTTPRATLITNAYPVDRQGNPWKKRFQKIESRLGSLKEKYSVPFPIQGVRIVPKSRGREMMDELYGMTIGRLRNRIKQLNNSGDYRAAELAQRSLNDALTLEGENADANTPVFDYTKEADGQSIAYELHRASTEFCNDWPNIRQQIADKNAVFHQVESRVPRSGGVMRTKFHLDVVPVELAGNTRRANSLTLDDLEEHSAIVQDACRRRVEEAIETMIAAPRQQLVEAMAELQELIARDGRVTSKSFAPVRAAIAKIRMFDCVANADMLAQIDNLERVLNTTNTHSLDHVTAAQSGFTAAINSFKAEVQDAEKQSRDLEEFGREFRSLILD